MSKCLICNISKLHLKDFKYNYSYLKENDLDIEVKDLVLESNMNETPISFKYPFVYMFDYTEEEMNEITTYFKQKQIYPIYCASTSSNLLWTLKNLLNELVKEHMTFYSINQLQNLIKQAMKLPLNENKTQIEKTLMEAFIILQEKDLDKMNHMIITLQKLIKENS